MKFFIAFIKWTAPVLLGLFVIINTWGLIIKNQGQSDIEQKDLESEGAKIATALDGRKIEYFTPLLLLLPPKPHHHTREFFGGRRGGEDICATSAIIALHCARRALHAPEKTPRDCQKCYCGEDNFE